MSEDNKPDIQSVDDFFKSQIYQQQIQTSAGWTTIFQAMVASASKAIIDDGKSVDMHAIKELMELTKVTQVDTIEIMAKMKDAE